MTIRNRDMVANPRRFAAGAVSVVALILLAACSDDPSPADVPAPGNGDAGAVAPGNGDAGACADGIWNNDECSAWSTCAAGTYVASAPSAKADRTCASCTSGTFSAAPNAESCTTWTTCKPGSYVATPGSTTTDQVWAPCAAGTYSSSDNQANCVPLGECPAGRVEKTPGTSTSPPVCAACDAGSHCAGGKAPMEACASGTWDHDKNPATACVAWTDGVAGQAVSVEGSATTNRTCTACAGGSFSTTTNAASCTPMTDCEPGSFVSTAGTAVAARQCTTCPPGQTSTATNATACVAEPVEPQLVAGAHHTCALLFDATVRCWGENSSGQLGDGTTARKSTPTVVLNLPRVTKLASSTGANHTCALLEDRSVRCWGANFSGQLGDGTDEQKLTPVIVPGLSDVTDLAVADAHTCAILDNRTVRCWGGNFNGQLGDGTTENRPAPTAVPGLSNVTGLAAGGQRTCAFLADNTVRCWGLNNVGQFGDGTTVSSVSPTAIANLFSVTKLALASHHSCGIFAGGSVRCWGRGSWSALGDGTGANKPTPTEVVPSLSGAVEVVVGGDSTLSAHSCARLGDGSVRCWGDSRRGQLGDGTTDTKSSPTAVLQLSNVTELVAGAYRVCAGRGNAGLSCWGANSSGQLGDGTTTDRSSPVLVAW
ncbi:MAG: hypothetical protein J0I07_43670 [Myxococcales bacterium]|nr:hypothetical protein [Myxococcales bacterium]